MAKGVKERVRERPEEKAKGTDLSINSVAFNALQKYGYPDNVSEVLVSVLHELREDGPEETAATFKLFRKIAGVVRKPRKPSGTQAATNAGETS